MSVWMLKSTSLKFLTPKRSGFLLGPTSSYLWTLADNCLWSFLSYLNMLCFSVSSHQVVLELIGLEVGLLIVHFTSDRNEKVVVSGRIDSRRPRSREKMLNVVSNLQKHAATSHICPTCPSTWSCRRQSSDARNRRRAGFFVRPDLVTGQSGNWSRTGEGPRDRKQQAATPQLWITRATAASHQTLVRINELHHNSHLRALKRRMMMMMMMILNRRTYWAEWCLHGGTVRHCQSGFSVLWHASHLWRLIKRVTCNDWLVPKEGDKRKECITSHVLAVNTSHKDWYPPPLSDLIKINIKSL